MTIPPKYATAITKVLWLVIGEGLALAFMLGAVHSRSFGLGLIAMGFAIFGVSGYLVPMSMTNHLREEISDQLTRAPHPVADRLSLVAWVLVAAGILLRWLT